MVGHEGIVGELICVRGSFEFCRGMLEGQMREIRER